MLEKARRNRTTGGHSSSDESDGNEQYYNQQSHISRPRTTPKKSHGGGKGGAGRDVVRESKTSQSRTRQKFLVNDNGSTNGSLLTTDNLKSHNSSTLAPPSSRRDHMNFLRENVEGMRRELGELGRGLGERGLVNSHLTFGNRPTTAPAHIVDDNNNNPSNDNNRLGNRADNTTLCVIEEATVSSEIVILKFILDTAITTKTDSYTSSSSSHQPTITTSITPSASINNLSTDVNESSILPLRIEGWDRSRKRRIKNLALTALDCDRLCGFSPNELGSLTGKDRLVRLGRVARELKLERVADELEVWEEAEEKFVELEEEVDSGAETETEESEYETDTDGEEGRGEDDNDRDIKEEKKSANAADAALDDESNQKGLKKMRKKKKTIKTRVDLVIVKKSKTIKRFKLELAKPLPSKICQIDGVLLNRIKVDLWATHNPKDNGSVTVTVNRSRSNRFVRSLAM